MQISSSPFSVVQIGNGVPQYLDLLKFQSTIFSNQFPNLPDPVDSGCQLISLFICINSFLNLVVAINQDSNG